MKINGIDISNYNATLINRVASTQKITTIVNQLDDLSEGQVLSQYYDYKTLSVTFVVKCPNDEDLAYKKISQLTEDIKNCNIEFDDIQLVFPCYLNDSATPERVQNGVFKVTYLLYTNWGLGGETVAFDSYFPKPDVYKINLKYYYNWVPTMRGYANCFDRKYWYEYIDKETLYIDKTTLEEKANAALSWNELFLAFGVDLDKYKKINTLNGFVHITDAYTPEAALTYFDTHTDFNIYYNRYQKEGFVDLPEKMTYPSVVWYVKDNNYGYELDLKVGKGLKIEDITIYVWGRWYETKGAGSMFGAGQNDGFGMAFLMPKVKQMVGNITAEREDTVFGSTYSGGSIIVQTFEDIDATLIRKYGFKSSVDGAIQQVGFADVIFNGTTVDRTDTQATELQENIRLLNGRQGVGKYIDIARVQVFNKGQLIRDAVPINGSLMNGFMNLYSQGLYDINTMEFLPWKNENGDTGATPPALMPIPSTPGDIVPPDKPEPMYTLTVVGGSGSGKYKAGELINLVPTESKGEQQFKNWTVTSGDYTFADPTAPEQHITMPDGDLTLTVEYEAVQYTDNTFWNYESKATLTSEYIPETNAIKIYADKSGMIYNGVPYTIVYSVPNSEGAWIPPSSANAKPIEIGYDKWNRPFLTLTVQYGGKWLEIGFRDDTHGKTSQANIWSGDNN